MQKYHKRLARVQKLVKGPQVDKVKWEMAKDIIEELDVDGQSSEYTDSEDERGLKVTVPQSRRRVIGPVLHDVDVQGQELEKKARRIIGKRANPRPLKRRRITDEILERTIPSGLPLALYDPDFLASLPEDVQDGLRIKQTKLPLFEQWALAQEGGATPTAATG
ncbi:hypothetical protein PM082_021909 [Marasmius tenuissimus]|nr:hypothetical protein PM082_021909 [Marasmius tenuissimus]